MAHCTEIRDLLSLYIDGAVSDADKVIVETHITECAACREELASLRALVASLRALPDVEPPDGFHEQSMVRIRALAQTKTARAVQMPRKRASWRAYASAAAGFIVTLLGLSALVMFADNLTGTSKSDSAGYGGIARSSIEATGGDSTAEVSNGIGLFGIESDDLDQKYADSGIAPAADLAEVPNMLAAQSAAAQPNSHSVKRYNLTVTVDHFDHAAESIKAYAGILLNSQVHVNDETVGYGSYRTGYFEKSLPIEQFDSAVDFFRALGKIEDENHSQYSVVYDITDYQARLSSKQTEYDRLMLLMKQADDISSMLVVQSRINTVISELEYYQSQLLYYSQLTGSPVITVHMEEKAPEIKIELEPETFGDNVRDAFIGSVNGTVLAFEQSLISLSGALLPLALIGAVTTIVVWCVRKRGKKVAK